MTSLRSEQVLAAAVVKQALRDTQHTNALIRADAVRFLRDRAALAFWCDVLGLPEARVQQSVTAVLDLQPLSAQLTFW